MYAPVKYRADWRGGIPNVWPQPLPVPKLRGLYCGSGGACGSYGRGLGAIEWPSDPWAWVQSLGSGVPLLLAGLGGVWLLSTLLGKKGKRKGKGGGIRDLQQKHREQRAALGEQQAIELVHARAKR